MDIWKTHNEEGLKQRADYLFLKLSEIGHRVYPEEGLVGAHILRTVWRKSKKNQYGNVEQNTLLRHKDVEKCPFGALSFFFFYRYHVRGDAWPDFSNPKNWYDLYVFPNGIHSNKPTTYTKQYESIKKAQQTLSNYNVI